jgi:TDG/mug DNA glycosylase family protein
MPRVLSFAPVAADDAEVLILGSMPGTASLTAGQYYAHSRNAFWPLLGRVLGFDAAAPYERRLDALRAARIALWDVLHSCRRRGSLDSSIERETQVPNDFAAFFAMHRRIDRVLFNGAKAEDVFRRHVLRVGIGASLQCVRLPSTSPANASWSFERKLGAWREAVLEGRPVPGSGSQPTETSREQHPRRQG